ncbi:Eco29kI family restriction endonuclease [Streptomyces azureus]|uniref:SacII n=1 Tax=Streptomyces azureus TaxID=146537 RepID=A0A0K8PYW5_STRAJ|nr:Eco29kI family restriction endonuclease [Streptomyces azureus]GAP52654.1 SacII [Streptomyces azureus]
MRLENHAEFKLSITKALGDQLAAALEELTPAQLNMENIQALHPSPGVYQLYKGEELVYVGKADRSLPRRIEKHLRKISGRTNIDIAEMAFTCLYVDEDFGAVAPERLLINKHRGQGGVPWNYNGFGNNDPGKRRDTTVVDEEHFDRAYPIDLEFKIANLLSAEPAMDGTVTLASLLSATKTALPYVFRYESSEAFEEIQVAYPDEQFTADEVLRLAASHLPSHWQITALPGYVIMYGKRELYPSAIRYYRNDAVIDVTE